MLAQRINLPHPASTPPEMDDSRLIDAACHGDAGAYATLVEKYQNRLCGSITRQCGSLVDAQDAAQEAFLRAYVKLQDFSGASSFYTWLYRIAINAMISQKRRRRAVMVSERTFEAAA